MIGILGGMGTQAGLDFCNKLAKLNRGKLDQQYPMFVLYNKSNTPKRPENLKKYYNVLKALVEGCKMLQKNNGILQYFYVKQLCFNPTKHQYVPLHEKIDESEVEKILEQYSVTSKLKLPWIYHYEPQAKWLGLKQGDIVRITSYNSNSGTYYRYRCCI